MITVCVEQVDCLISGDWYDRIFHINSKEMGETLLDKGKEIRLQMYRIYY